MREVGATLAPGWHTGRVEPELWINGHTTVATQASLLASLGRTRLLNVTGGVLVELDPSRGAPTDGLT